MHAWKRHSRNGMVPCSVKWHSEAWPVAVTSHSIRLYTSLWLCLTWPLPNHKMFHWSIWNGCEMPAGNAYPSRHTNWNLCSGSGDNSTYTCHGFSDFSLRISLGTFSILHCSLFIINKSSRCLKNIFLLSCFISWTSNFW